VNWHGQTLPCTRSFCAPALPGTPSHVLVVTHAQARFVNVMVTSDQEGLCVSLNFGTASDEVKGHVTLALMRMSAQVCRGGEFEMPEVMTIEGTLVAVERNKAFVLPVKRDISVTGLDREDAIEKITKAIQAKKQEPQ